MQLVVVISAAKLLGALIVLNIGCGMGFRLRQLFAMMVVMALVTRMMTGLLLSLVERWRATPAPVPAR